MVEDTTDRPVSATRARQGRRGKPVLWVLAISTALAVAALLTAWILRSGDLAAAEEQRTLTPAEARQGATEPATVRQTTDDPPATDPAPTP